MANNGDLLIGNKDKVYRITVSGRATFECAPPLRSLAKKLETEIFEKIYIDLSKCSWMDSTFMGILAMLGLQAKKINASVFVCNASEQNQGLLCGLGLRKLFQFITDDPDSRNAIDNIWTDDNGKAADGNARTVLEAHQTLMDVDEQNVKKFENVVDMVQKDIDRMNESKQD